MTDQSYPALSFGAQLTTSIDPNSSATSQREQREENPGGGILRFITHASKVNIKELGNYLYSFASK